MRQLPPLPTAFQSQKICFWLFQFSLWHTSAWLNFESCPISSSSRTKCSSVTPTVHISFLDQVVILKTILHFNHFNLSYICFHRSEKVFANWYNSTCMHSDLPPILDITVPLDLTQLTLSGSIIFIFRYYVSSASCVCRGNGLLSFL